MVHIYTFCDKTLVGRSENLSAKFLCENLFKLNMRIDEVCTFCNKYDYESLNFKNKNIYFLLMQKSSSVLNSYLASLAGVTICENQSLKTAVEEYYKTCNQPPENDASLEYLIPQNSISITNPNGKTQGYLIKIAESVIFVLPNGFEELKAIYNDCILEYLEKHFPTNYKSETYKTFGLNESFIKNILANEIKNKDGVYISIFSKGLDNDVVIKAKEDNIKFEDYRREVFSKLEKYIYSVQDMSLKQKLQNDVLSQNIKIAFAGDLSVCGLTGLVDSSIATNLAECVVLPNVNSIANFLGGSVLEISPEVAYDIAVITLEKSKADLVLASLCNLHGQNRGETYIAIGNKIKIDIYKNKFLGSEQDILRDVTQTSMFYLVKRLSLRDLKTI